MHKHALKDCTVASLETPSGALEFTVHGYIMYQVHLIYLVAVLFIIWDVFKLEAGSDHLELI